MYKDKQAFLSLYEPVERQISNYCRALAGNEQAACDLLQDTLLAALENFSQLKKPESFLFFLIGIAKRIYLKQLRRNKLIGDIEKIDLEHYTITNTAETGLENEMLYMAINQLPMEQREALVMFEIMGFSLKEIQDYQGGSLSGVKSRIVRARQKLAEMLTGPKKEVVVITHKTNLL